FCQGRGNHITALKRIKLPHSLGQFYSAVTNLLGFDMFQGDEWKVMGLAAYGKPEYSDFFSQRVLSVTGPESFRVNVRVLDHHLALGRPRSYQMDHAYFGPSYDSSTCAAVLRDAGLGFETLRDDELLPRVARIIADGGIVGWFQGRMEFGPRALGSRSFLADP